MGAVAGDEILVPRHRLGGPGDRGADAGEEVVELRCRHRVRERIIAARGNLLSFEDRRPARLSEELVVDAEEAAMAPPQLQLFLQAVGYPHLATLLPEWLAALVGVIVKDQKVADALIFECCGAIVEIDVSLVEIAIREQVEQLEYSGLDQVDARGFERLHEPRGEAQRHDVAVPELAPFAGDEAQLVRFGQHPAFQVRAQDRLGLVVRHEGAGVDVAVAGPVLERNAPLPARGLCRAAGEGGGWAGTRAGQGDRTVAG
jgi:hypothetical protein